MKILYAVRLFSGFETSVVERRWRPTGAPTIYKMMDALDRGPDEAHFVLTCKDTYVPWAEEADSLLRLEGLDTPVRVLANPAQRRHWAGRYAAHLGELRQTMALFSMARRLRPDLMYVSSANFVAGALVARYTGIPVVLRMMGVYPAQRAALTGTRWVHKLSRWAYRSPFACVVCTQDGSGGETWLDRAFGPHTPRELLINGIDRPGPEAGEASVDERLAGLPAGRTVVSWVGKLERDKGADSFMKGFLAAWKATGGALHALVVGTGRLAAAMRTAAEAAGAGATFIDRLPHDQIRHVHERSDIYVSLNRLGNLSNANLEAMCAGSCMVFPESQPETGVDLATDRLIPRDAALRIPHADDTAALAGALESLHADPARRAAVGARMAEVARALVPSWDERVSCELELLRGIAAGRKGRGAHQ